MKNIQGKGKEYVVLVTSKNKVIGTAPKLEAHNQNTPLHRGFSLFLFNKKGDILLQQRSAKKKTWSLVWSNSCCGHPLLDESNTDAARRRLRFELGLKQSTILEVLPDFSYRAEKNGVVENEICPVLIGFSRQEPRINRDEVETTKWIYWKEFLKEIDNNPTNYSPWCIKEASLLKDNKKFLSFYKKFTS